MHVGGAKAYLRSLIRNVEAGESLRWHDAAVKGEAYLSSLRVNQSVRIRALPLFQSVLEALNRRDAEAVGARAAQALQALEPRSMRPPAVQPKPRRP